MDYNMIAICLAVAVAMFIALVVLLSVFLRVGDEDGDDGESNAGGEEVGSSSNPPAGVCKEFLGFDAACTATTQNKFLSPTNIDCYSGNPNKPSEMQKVDPSKCDSDAVKVYSQNASGAFQLNQGLTGSSVAEWVKLGPLKCYCSTQPPPPPPPTKCPASITTDSSLVLYGAAADAFKKLPSAQAKQTIDTILSQGDIYGDVFVTQCDSKRTATDTWSKLLCGGKQVQVCPQDPTGATACEKSKTCSKCADYFAPLGAALQLTLNDLGGSGKPPTYSHQFQNLPSAEACPNEREYRGVCIPDTMNGVATTLDQSYCDGSRPYGIALYHGGKAGLPEIDAKCFIGYALEIAAFVEYRDIERVFLSVDAPLPYDGGTVPKQNSYFLQPQFVAYNFLGKLGGKTKSKRQREVGFIVYASPGDSGWNFQIDSPYSQCGQSTASDFVKNLCASCDTQWKMSVPDPRSTTAKPLPDITPFPLQDAASKTSQCFSNPAAASLLGGNLMPVPPVGQGCGYFSGDHAFQPLGSNTPCPSGCYDQTCSEMAAQVKCGTDADCVKYVGGHCAPYATQAAITCGSKGMCELTCSAPSCDPTSFSACAQKSLCCGSKNVASDGTSAVRAVFPKLTGGTLPCGCPNIASQVVAYVTAVNKAVDALVAKGLIPADTPKVTMVAYDGEDAHANNGAAGQCQSVQMMQSKGLRVFPTRLRSTGEDAAEKKEGAPSQPAGSLINNVPHQLGHAYAMGTTPYPYVTDPINGTSASPTSTTLSFAMPEMYWFMGINWPCIGSHNNLNNRPDVCTTVMAYRDFQGAMKAKSTLSMLDFYLWILAVQPCGDESQFTPMQKNMRDFRGQVWPMISSEYLSGSDPKNTTNPCLARAANGGNIVESICGTCDMMYTYEWCDILQFFGAIYEDCYKNKWGNYAGDALPTDGSLPFVALYEAQFINPKWTEAGKWTLLESSCVAPSDRTPLNDLGTRGRHRARVGAAATGCGARCMADDCRCKWDNGGKKCVKCKEDSDCSQGGLTCVPKASSKSCNAPAPAACTAKDCRCKNDVDGKQCVKCKTDTDCGSDPHNVCADIQYSKSCG
jgi:hypothetical protein